MESDAHKSPAIPTDPPDAYPHALCRSVELADGSQIEIRPIVPADIERIRHAFSFGDADSIRRRFLTGAPPSDESHLHYLAEVDYDERLAVLAMDSEGDSVGVARYEGGADRSSAEVAVVVVPEWRKRGVGSVLVEALETHARQVGITRFVAAFQPDNRAIDGLLADLGFGERCYEDGLAWVSKHL
jgi:GNAT superfamily N-acetyltransferase